MSVLTGSKRSRQQTITNKSRCYSTKLFNHIRDTSAGNFYEIRTLRQNWQCSFQHEL